LCDSETWVFYIDGRNRLRVFESGLLSKMFGPQRETVTQGWRKFHSHEFYDLRSSPSIFQTIISRRMSGEGNVACMEEKTGACCRVLVGKPEGKTGLGRHQRRWENNIKFDLKDIRWKSVNWIDLAGDGDTL
jgi:hypothetical protein